MAGPAKNPAEEIVERGLEKYGAGDLIGALSEWESALALDPGSQRATEYLTYVRENFDALDEQFRAAHAAHDDAEAQGMPTPESTIGADTSSEAYDALELADMASLGHASASAPPLPAPPGAGPPAATFEDDNALDGVSAGLDQLALQLAGHPDDDPEPPEISMEAGEPDDHPAKASQLSLDSPYGEHEPTTGNRVPVLTIRPREHTSPGGSGPGRELDLDISGLSLHGDDEGTQERTQSSVFGRQGPADEQQTIERHAIPLSSSEISDLDLIGGGTEFGDDNKTSERAFAAARAQKTGGGERGGRSSAGVIIDENLLRAYDDVDPPSMRAAGGAAPLPPRDDSAVGARVMELMTIAREAAERGDFRAAVEAAELASAEDPDGSIASVIFHRQRDLLHAIYEGHIGDMTQVPLVAVPLHTIAAAELDHRTGFLLSRIDGMLSFEDILDVAGMPRMEAYRILSRLLRKQFIEVR